MYSWGHYASHTRIPPAIPILEPTSYNLYWKTRSETGQFMSLVLILGVHSYQGISGKTGKLPWNSGSRCTEWKSNRAVSQARHMAFCTARLWQCKNAPVRDPSPRSNPSRAQATPESHSPALHPGFSEADSCFAGGSWDSRADFRGEMGRSEDQSSPKKGSAEASSDCKAA